MSVISERFARELATEKAMREAYLSAQTRTKLTNQIRAIRTQRGWSQGEFATRLHKPQSNVSRIENREYGAFTLTTLLELANAFDCGLIVEFVAYDEFLRRTHNLSQSHLQVQKFSANTLQPLYQSIPNTWHNVLASPVSFSSLNFQSLQLTWDIGRQIPFSYDSHGCATGDPSQMSNILTGFTAATITYNASITVGMSGLVSSYVAAGGGFTAPIIPAANQSSSNMLSLVS